MKAGNFAPLSEHQLHCPCCYWHSSSASNKLSCEKIQEVHIDYLLAQLSVHREQCLCSVTMQSVQAVNQGSCRDTLAVAALSTGQGMFHTNGQCATQPRRRLLIRYQLTILCSGLLISAPNRALPGMLCQCCRCCLSHADILWLKECWKPVASKSVVESLSCCWCTCRCLKQSL
jgi:hypothetical protein